MGWGRVEIPSDERELYSTTDSKGKAKRGVHRKDSTWGCAIHWTNPCLNIWPATRSKHCHYCYPNLPVLALFFPPPSIKINVYVSHKWNYKFQGCSHCRRYFILREIQPTTIQNLLSTLALKGLFLVEQKSVPYSLCIKWSFRYVIDFRWNRTCKISQQILTFPAASISECFLRNLLKTLKPTLLGVSISVVPHYSHWFLQLIFQSLMYLLMDGGQREEPARTRTQEMDTPRTVHFSVNFSGRFLRIGIPGSRKGIYRCFLYLW